MAISEMTSRGLVDKPLRPQFLVALVYIFSCHISQHFLLHAVNMLLCFLCLLPCLYPCSLMTWPIPLHWNVHMCTQQTLFFIVADDCDDNKAERVWVALAHYLCRVLKLLSGEEANHIFKGHEIEVKTISLCAPAQPALSSYDERGEQQLRENKCFL